MLIDWMCRIRKREESSMGPSSWIGAQCHEQREGSGMRDGGEGNMSQHGFGVFFLVNEFGALTLLGAASHSEVSYDSTCSIAACPVPMPQVTKPF